MTTTTNTAVKRADWVVTKSDTSGAMFGFVTRMAKDGTWADVRWMNAAGLMWQKRMPTSVLIVKTTIHAFGYDITDETRAREIADEGEATS